MTQTQSTKKGLEVDIEETNVHYSSTVKRFCCDSSNILIKHINTSITKIT